MDAFVSPQASDGPAVQQTPQDATAGLILDDRFLMALTWQNADIMRNWVAEYRSALLTGQSKQLSRRARKEALIARYAQRYCTKNDTIGFFGGVAWAVLSESPVTLRKSGSLDQRRAEAYFEVGAVELIAERWRRDPRLRAELPVRVNPSFWFDGALLYRPHRTPTRLGRAPGVLLSLLTEAGRLPVAEIVARAQCLAPDRDEDGWSDALADLEKQGIIRIGFSVPLDARPDVHLRRQVEALSPSEAKAEMIDYLDTLERERQGTLCVTEPASLLDRLGKVDSLLAQAAGGPVASPKSTGTGLRVGRTPIYLDTRRDLDLEIGEGLLAPLREPLALVLRAAHWLTTEVGTVADRHLRIAYETLRKHSTHVSLADLQFAAAELLTGSAQELSAVLEDFQLRWAEILAQGDLEDEREVRLSIPRVRSLFETLFPRRPLQWTAARYHSPDLLLCQEDGSTYRWVLGELHVALNTLESRVFLTQSDDPDLLRESTRRDLPDGRIVPISPNGAVEASSRTYPPTSLDPPGHYQYWSYGFDEGHPSGATSVPATAIEVHCRDGRVLGALPDAQEIPVLEFFGEFLTALVVNMFEPRSVVGRAPRVCLGDLVVLREQWRTPVGQIQAAAAPPGGKRRSTPLQVWLDRAAIPRHFFVKTSAEPKPFYVDSKAGLLLKNMERAIRRVREREGDGAVIEIVEMLPGPSHFWLHDANGDSYTAELRIVAVEHN